MLIILNITTNRLTVAGTETSYMLDFNEVFSVCGQTHKIRGKTAEKWGKKRGKNAGKLRILKFFLRTWCVADANLQTWTRCVADADYLPTSNGHGAWAPKTSHDALLIRSTQIASYTVLLLGTPDYHVSHV